MGQYKQTRGCSAAPAAGFFLDVQKETKKPPRGVFGGKRAFWCGGAQVRLRGSQAGEDTRPYEMRGPSGLARRGRRPRRPAGAHCAPLRQKTDRERWLGKLRRRSGTAPKVYFANAGPQWVREKSHSSTPDFARRKFSAHLKGVTPVMGVRGVGEYGRVSAHPEPTPWRFFGSFLPGQKGTRPAGRNPPAALRLRRRGQAPALQRKGRGRKTSVCTAGAGETFPRPYLRVCLVVSFCRISIG